MLNSRKYWKTWPGRRKIPNKGGKKLCSKKISFLYELLKRDNLTSALRREERKYFVQALKKKDEKEKFESIKD